MQTAGNMLWTAPELLQQQPTGPGSKSGDTYSFGIILQEIILQTAPFDGNIIEAASEEIVEKVKAQLQPPYRPVIPDGKVTQKSPRNQGLS